jgi:hypothetical protein
MLLMPPLRGYRQRVTRLFSRGLRPWLHHAAPPGLMPRQVSKEQSRESSVEKPISCLPHGAFRDTITPSPILFLTCYSHGCLA